MCGIVGYVGSSQAAEFLIEGLRRLEYRGYDSSGVVTADGGELAVKKTAGRVQDLSKVLHSSPAVGHVGRRIAINRFLAIVALPKAHTFAVTDVDGRPNLHSGFRSRTERLTGNWNNMAQHPSICK